MQISIPVSKTQAFEDNLKRLNKKQAQYGLPITHAEHVRNEFREINFVTHEKWTAFKDDTVTAERVEFAVYEIDNAEVVTKDGESFTYMGSRSVIDGEVVIDVTDKTYTTEVAVETDTCDHCHTKRQRNKYHVFKRDMDGRIFRVGSTCASDFFGFKANEYLACFIKTFFVVGGEEDYWESCKCSENIAYDWSAVYATVKEHTKDFEEYDYQNFDYKIKYGDEDCSDDMQKVIDYWQSRLREAEDDDAVMKCGVDMFTWNCASLVTSGACPRRLLGLAYAAIYTAVKKLRWQKLRKVTFDELPKYTDGQKITFGGKCIMKKRIEQYFGYVTLVGVDVDGLQYKMFTSAKRFNDVEKGDDVEITAEFVKYDEFNENFSIMVKRPKLINVQKQKENEQHEKASDKVDEAISEFLNYCKQEA